MATPDYLGIALEPADYAFVDFIVDEVTEGGQLPFSFPPASIPKVAAQSALWFWRESEEAVEEKWFMCRLEDMPRADGLNAVLKLPENIEAVLDLHTVRGTQSYGSAFAFMRDPMLLALAMGGGGGGGYLSGRRSSSERSDAWTEGIARLYEYSQINSLFKKSVRYDYNPLTHKINFMGRLDGDIVMSTLVRIPMEDLYRHDLFQRHVAACCRQRLKSIISQFGMPMPGEAEINLESLQERGADERKEIEESIKADSSPSDLIFMR